MKKSSRTGAQFFAIFSLFFYQTVSCYGQAKLPEVIPPSPNAYIFQKFTDVPVTYYSGLPNVNIPVYTIKTGDFQYPISLSYHTGGIRAEDKASWVGLNWVLNGVGMISRTTMDGADDVANGFFYNAYDPYTLQNNLGQLSVLDQLIFYGEKVCYRYDLQPDMYYLNAGNMSVKFYMNKQKQVIQINKTNIQITPVFQGDPLNETYGTLKGFTVVDGEGIRYYFGNGLDEKMFIDLLNSGSCIRYNLYRSGWYLEKLITAQNDTLHFEYEADNTHYYSRPFTTLTINSDAMGWFVNHSDPVEYCTPLPEFSSSLTDVTVYGNRLKTIYFSQGRVEFYVSARLDFDAGNKKLDSVKVYNSLNKMVAGCKFNYDYYSDVYTGFSTPPLPNPSDLDTYKRLRLLSVRFFNNQTELPPYLFEYTNNTLPLKMSTAIDHWGYYNASNNNGWYMPYFLMNVSISYSTPFHPLRRNSNAYRMSTDSMSRGSLYRITYPTGGHTQFEFEPNEVYMRNFSHAVSFDQVPWVSDPGPSFQLQEINAIPDTAGVVQTITVTNQNTSNTFTLSSQCGYRYVQITAADFPDYTNSNLRFWINISPSYYSVYCKNLNEVDQYLWLLENGQYTLQINLVDEFNMPVQSINDPVTVTLSIKEDILDFCQEKNRKVGGLRVKKIDTYDPAGDKTIHKEFDYSDAEYPARSSGSLTNKPIYFNSSRQATYGVHWVSYWCGYLNFSEKSHIGDSKTGGNSVGYNHVTELFAENGQQGKTTYDYISPKEMPDDFTYELDKYPFPPTASYDWARGLLVGKQAYRRTGSGFAMVQKDSMTYNFNIANPALEGVALGNNWHTNFNGNNPFSTPFQVCFLNIKEYDIPHGAVRQATNYHTEYGTDNNQTITTIEKKVYDNFPHEQPMRTEAYDSKGNLVKTENKYPYDFPGTPVYDAMIARNIINPLVEQSTFKSGDLLQSSKTNFKDWSNSIVAPYTVEIKTGNNPPDLRLQYHAYDDKGNILSVSKKDDTRNSYLWGYNQTLPIARIINADPKDVFYTSFEDTEGNSFDSDSKTGRKSRTGGYTRSLSNLTNGNYVLTWWEKNGSNWTLQVNVTVAVTGSSYTINLPGQIDELRFYPMGAQMTTYAYEPLLGMTSQCDVGNHITYYEYDAMARLQLILDHDRNVLKRFCYNYAGQPENCAQ